jgi:predicted SAM-dependent methyltransferase
MKLNVGCGSDIREGYVNLDYHNRNGADVVFNLKDIYSGNKLPFNNNSAKEIILYDVLEHMETPLPILRELYRVCEVGGMIKIKVPEGKWVWDNLDHKRQFSIRSFMVTNFDDYMQSGEKKVVVENIERYVLPSRNFLFKIARWVFGKTNLKIYYRRLK